MSYSIEIRSKVLKSLVKINEPHYSALKKQLYDLADNPRPIGYRK
jgi:mRNA interferase RelE/StbE